MPPSDGMKNWRPGSLPTIDMQLLRMDGWDLERYSWDKVTGKARFTYTKGNQTRVLFNDQPTWAGGKPLDLGEIPASVLD